MLTKHECRLRHARLDQRIRAELAAEVAQLEAELRRRLARAKLSEVERAMLELMLAHPADE